MRGDTHSQSAGTDINFSHLDSLPYPKSCTAFYPPVENAARHVWASLHLGMGPRLLGPRNCWPPPGRPTRTSERKTAPTPGPLKSQSIAHLSTTIIPRHMSCISGRTERHTLLEQMPSRSKPTPTLHHVSPTPRTLGSSVPPHTSP